MISKYEKKLVIGFKHLHREYKDPFNPESVTKIRIMAKDEALFQFYPLNHGLVVITSKCSFYVNNKHLPNPKFEEIKIFTKKETNSDPTSLSTKPIRLSIGHSTYLPKVIYSKGTHHIP